MIRRGLTPVEWARFGAMVAAVIGLHVLGWGVLTAALGGHYHIGKTAVFGVGTGALAYTLGTRHAFDADHIAAIGNTTRKLVQEGRRPLSVGLFSPWVIPASCGRWRFNVNTAGLFIVGVFVVTWVVAVGIRHFGRIEQRWETDRTAMGDAPE